MLLSYYFFYLTLTALQDSFRKQCFAPVLCLFDSVCVCVVHACVQMFAHGCMGMPVLVG